MLHSASLVPVLTTHLEFPESINERRDITLLYELYHKSRSSMMFKFLLKWCSLNKRPVLMIILHTQRENISNWEENEIIFTAKYKYSF
jgi:hypothetical protein